MEDQTMAKCIGISSIYCQVARRIKRSVKKHETEALLEENEEWKRANG